MRHHAANVKAPVMINADAQIRSRLIQALNLNPTPPTSISNDGVTSNPRFGQVQGAFAGRIVELQARFSF